MRKKLFLASILIPVLSWGQLTFNGNGNSGFGGVLGNGSLTASDNGTTISFTFNGAASLGTNFLVLYIDSESGGFTTTSTFNDVGDNHRKSISGLDGSNRATANFPPGFSADFAIALNSSFAGLWDLQGTGSHTYVTSVNVANPSGNTYTFDVDFSEINTTDIPTAFNFVATIISGTAFRSNEAIGDGISGTNPGFNSTINYDTYFQYGSGSKGGRASTATANDWSNSATWANGNVPLAGDAITIAHDVTLNQDATIASLTLSAGTFTASDGSARTLTISTDASGSATTMTNSGGTWANGTGGSTVVFSGNPNSGDAIHQTSGSFGFQNVTIQKESGASNNVGVDFQTNSSVSGTLEIGEGGYVSTAPPSSFYGGSAILAFNQGTGANYVVGASDNSWSTTEVPQNITITSGTVTLQGDRTATGNLIVSSNGTLAIDPGNDLEINGNFSLDGTLTLNADASSYSQLKVDGNITNNGTFNFEQYLHGGWHMIASPFDATTASIFGNVGTNATGGTVNTENLYAWDGTQYVNVANNAASVSPGMGYYGYVGQYGIQDNGTTTYSFTGNPNTSVNTGSLTLYNNTVTTAQNLASGSNEGWNLLGNPFTCELDFSAIATRSDFANSFYIYDPDGASYSSYSSGGITDPYIAPMQAFWVQATGASPTLGTLTMATHGTVGNSPAFRKSNQVNFDRVVLRTEATQNSNAKDYTVVSLVGNSATQSYDEQWDARKLYNGGDNPNIYSVHQSLEMAVNAIDYGPGYNQTVSIPLGFKAPVNGESYTISLDGSYMLNQYLVVLEDKHTDELIDLSLNDYSFSYDENQLDRFVLHLNALNIGIDELTKDLAEASLEAWINNQSLNIKADFSGEASFELVDLSGKTVWSTSKNFDANQTISVAINQNLNSGIYILRYESPSLGQRAHKVFLK